MGNAKACSERQVSLADRFTLTGMGMDQARHVTRKCIPVGDQLGLADELADAGTDHVDAETGPLGLRTSFTKPRASGSGTCRFRPGHS